jgi:hypothetical protein
MARPWLYSAEAIMCMAAACKRLAAMGPRAPALRARRRPTSAASTKPIEANFSPVASCSVGGDQGWPALGRAPGATGFRRKLGSLRTVTRPTAAVASVLGPPEPIRTYDFPSIAIGSGSQITFGADCEAAAGRWWRRYVCFASQSATRRQRTVDGSSARRLSFSILIVDDCKSWQ